MAEGQVRLDLQVGLDTAYLQGQLATIGTRLAGQGINLAIKFDRQSIANEYRLLQRSIGRRAFDVKIESNTLEALSAKVKNFQERLRELSNEKIELDISAGAVKSLSRRDASKVRNDLRASVLGSEKKIYVPVSIKPAITRQDVRDFTNAVKSKLSGITVSVKANLEAQAISGGAKSRADIDADVRRGLQAISEMGAARMSGGQAGGVTEAARRQSLRSSIENLTVAQLKQVAKQLEVGGISGLRKANLIEKIVSDASVEMIKKYLDPQAVMRSPDRGPLQRVLDTFARGLFQMLGMDPAAIREAERLKRLPPAINWPARAPSRNIPIGPSSTGRALPPGAIPAALPGTSFAQQKRLVGDILSPSLKEALRGAANAFSDAVKASLNNAVRQVSVRDLGASAQLMLQGQRIAGLLPPATGMSVQDRVARAYQRSGAREMSVMAEGGQRMLPPAVGRVPSPYAMGRAVPAATGVVAGGRSGAGAAFARAMGGVQMPGTGVVRELAGEFGEATKQVLLFGTAYKALAFATSFPAQVGQAVSALQGFNNTLKAISPTAEEVRASNQFVLDIVGRYNIPLQSARDGFTKLYASMAPAGFKGDEVRDLFTGISQAAAAFGMSADKVDRVNYAFAQMASKGQVMSEELKGQLGDVLPGAMAIFAEAAGFEGSDAIEKFSKALEDGAYKGNAMKVLLTNVGTIMRKEFGPGAEGAARTFQGAINRMQNSLTFLYESFEPVAVGFLNAVVMPITGGIKQLTDGINAFFGKTKAQTAGGFAFAEELRKLTPAFQGIQKNAQQVIPVLQQFGNVALQLAQTFLQIAGNPFVGYLARVYLSVLPLTIAIQALNLRALVPLILSFARAIPAFIAFNAATVQGATANKALQLAMYTTGQTAGVTATKIRLVSTALKAAFASTLVLAVVAGIGMIIEKMIALNARMDETRQKALGAAEAVRSMGATEATLAARQAVRDVKVLQELSQQPSQGGLLGPKYVVANAEQKAALERAGLSTSRIALRGGGVGDGIERSMLRGAIEARQDVRRQAEYRQREIRFREQQAQAPVSLPAIPEAAADPEKAKRDADKAADEARRRAEQAASQEQQRIIAQAELRNQLNQIGLQKTKELSEEALDFAKRMIDAEFDYREARANRFGKMQIDIERRLAAQRQSVAEAFNRYQTSVLESQARTAAAQAKATAAAQADAIMPTAAAQTGAYLQGNIGPTSTGPHFDVKRVGGGFFPRDYLDQYVRVNGRPLSSGTTVPGGTFAGHQRRGSHGWDYAFGEGRYAATLTGGAEWMEGAPTEHGERRRFRLPTGETFQFLHGRSEGISSNGSSPVSGTAFSIEKREEAAKRDLQAAQAQSTADVEIAKKKLLNDLRLVEADQKASIAQATEKALPMEEQRLENMLSETRLAAQLLGLSDSQVDVLVGQTEATMRANAVQAGFRSGLKDLKDEQDEYNAQLQRNEINQEVYAKLTDSVSKRVANLNAEIAKINVNLPIYNQEMERAALATEAARPRLALVTALKEAKDAIKDLGTPAFQLIEIAQGVSTAFGDAFRGLISGASSAKEVLAGFFKTIGDTFAEMIARLITESVRANILQGVGNIFNLFGPQGSPIGAPGLGSPVKSITSPIPMANGGIAAGGFRAFATGGIVKGPTMGLVGEGRYNEAVVPLPDGKSIPVQLGGGAGSNVSTNIVVNVNNGQAQSQTTGQGGQALARELEGAVRQVILKESRPGGIIYSTNR